MSLILEAQQKWYRRTGGPKRKRPSASPEGADGAAEVAARFERDWDTFWSTCVAAHCRAELGGRMYSRSDTLRWMFPAEAASVELHPETRIPDRLLTGPFGYEEAKLSFWLIRGGAGIQHEHTWTWEVS
jgi:hypothetical protein